MAAPAVRAVGTVHASASAVTPGLPTGYQENDVLVLFVETLNQDVDVASPAGWVQTGSSPQSETNDSTRLTVFWKRAAASETAPTTTDSGDHQLGRIIAVSGCVTSGDPWDVTGGTTEAVSDTSGAIPSITTTVADTLVLVAATTGRDANSTTNFSAWTNANLTSLTEQIDNTTNARGGGGVGVASGVKSTAGAIGTTTVTYAVASRKALWAGALKPDSNQTITANAISNAATLPNPVVTPGAVTVTANALAVTATLPSAAVNNAASTQTITGNLLSVTAGLTGGVIQRSYQISADLLSASPTLPTAVNVSLSILAASPLTVTATLPNATVTTSYSVSGAVLSPAVSLPQASFSTGGVTVSAAYLQVVPSLPSAASVYLGSQYIFADVITIGTTASNWTVDDASVVVDGEESVDGLLSSVFPLATITQSVHVAEVAPTLPTPSQVKRRTIPAQRGAPQLQRPRTPSFTG